MNFDRSQQFFSGIVKPTVLEFLDSPGDIRRGSLAAIVLNQMSDYWATDITEKRVPSKAELLEARNTLSGSCPDLGFICDVADATKHAELTRETRTPHSSRHIQRDPGLFDAPFGEGMFAEAVRVFVVFPDGERKDLEPAIRAVLNFWECKLQ